MRIVMLLILLLGSPVTALADCADQQTLCNAHCEIRYLGDSAAVSGCRSKCIAERAVCSTKSGAETVFEAGQDAAEKTGSFIKGLTK